MGVIVMSEKWKSFIYGFLSLNLLWLIGHYIIDRPILPSPIVVYGNLDRLFLEQQLLTHIGQSLYRIFLSLIISVIIGLILGLLMAQSNFWNKILNPFIYFTYPIPKIALLPVILLLFGLGDASRITMIVLIIVFQIIINVRDSIRDIPSATYDILRCLGASKWTLFKEITLPAAFSPLLSSIRVALGTAMSILFITETNGTRIGLGAYINAASLRVNYVDMYGGIVVLSALAFLIFLIIDFIEDIFLKWREK